MANMRNSARRRARRAGRRRELHTGVIGRLLIMVAVVVAIVLGVAIFFRIRTVEVQGNSIYSWEQVANASGISPGDNLLCSTARPWPAASRRSFPMFRR